MPPAATLSIRQHPPFNGQYPIRLTLKRPDQPDIEAEANIAFALTAQSQEDLRWYMEDYLQNPESSEDVQVAQIEQMMRERGEELYQKVLAAILIMAPLPSFRLRMPESSAMDGDMSVA